MENEELNTVEIEEPQDTNAELDFDNIFDAEEEAVQDTNATEEPEAAPEEKTIEEPVQDTNVQDLEVDFLGKVQKVGADEVKPLVQKGLNYDHISAQAQEYKARLEKTEPIYAALEGISRQSGIGVEAIVEQIRGGLKQQIVQKYINNGLNEDMAKKLADMELEQNSRANAEKLAAEKRAKENTELERFMRVFPDVKSFEPEVLSLIKGGMTPTEAQMSYLQSKLKCELENAKKDNEALKMQLAGKSKNLQNASNTVGSAAGTAPAGAEDDFLAGFNF